MPVNPSPNPNGRNLLLSLMLGVVTAVVFGIGCFFLVYNSDGFMGWTLFLLVPLITGFATALVARRRNVIIASLIMGLIFCSAVLILTGFEGWVCVLMSAPLIGFGLSFGAAIGVLVRIYVINKARSSTTLTLLTLAITPLFVMGANSTEKAHYGPRIQTVSDTLVVNASPEAVWKELENMENITARKTFLMKIGLPVPVSCSTEGKGVGGKRTCYFEDGFIEERITEWNFPESMKFDIVASDVPGRPWLDFKDASYDISRAGHQTVIMRKTTIISRLSPAWYWRRLEAIGVHTEHEYLFEALDQNLQRSK